MENFCTKATQESSIPSVLSIPKFANQSAANEASFDGGH
jgi:hypothetical protein